MSQKTKYIVNSILWTLISTVISGALFQTFLLEKGISEENVGNLVSVMQFVQLIVILIFSKFIDRIKNVIQTTAFSHLLYLPLFVMMIILCFSRNTYFVPFVVCAVIACIAAGLYNVLAYKLPYHIMDMKNYGKWTGSSSVYAAIFMLIVTSLLSFSQNRIGYFPTMKFFCPFAVVIALSFSAMTASYEKVDFIFETKTEEKIQLLKYKPFTVLIIPNLIRGFCAGIIAMAVTIGYSTKQLNADYAGVLLVINQTVGIPANILYTKLTGREPKLILISSIGILASVSFIGRFNSIGFLVCYAIAYFCLCIVNVSVPVLVAGVIDYRIAGQYNGMRILLNTAGIFLASVTCIPLVNKFGSTATWIFAGAMQLVSGFVYFIYCKNKQNITHSEKVLNED